MAESFVPSVTLHFLHVREPEKLADGVDIEAAETWSGARGLSYFNIINFIQEPNTTGTACPPNTAQWATRKGCQI